MSEDMPESMENRVREIIREEKWNIDKYFLKLCSILSRLFIAAFLIAAAYACIKIYHIFY